MAKEDRLDTFVRDALAAGQDRDAVTQALAEAGWSAEQIREGLRAYADVDFPVPVPRPKHYVTAREAFTYLLTFAALYTCAVALGNLLFDIVDLLIPDPASSGFRGERSYIEDSIRWSVSILVPFFPLYVWLSVKTERALATDPTLRTSRVRKWLTYLTLFVAALFVLGDGSSLVYWFLMGELTLRLFLKILVVALIAGGVFGFYLWELKRDEAEMPSV